MALTADAINQRIIERAYDKRVLQLVERGVDPGTAAEQADLDLLRVLSTTPQEPEVLFYT